MHTLLDVRRNIPGFIHITDGLCNDVNASGFLPIEQGAFYLMDKGYIDYERLYAMHQQQAFFVTRTKDNIAGGIVFQMDQTSSENQHVLRNIRECSQNINMDLF